jgi:predicted GIY-YIG superfamily endonuclease
MYCYVLKLRGGRFYVGTTSDANPSRRISAHCRGGGSAWTTANPPLSVLETIPLSVESESDARLFEDMTVKRYMAKHGIDAVRGGTYSRVTLPDEQITALENELLHSANLCFICHRPGHFARWCPLRGR